MLATAWIRRKLRPAWAPVLGVCLVAYFAYHSIEGEHGFNARNQLTEQVAQAETTLAALREERAYLEHRADLMTPEHIDRDMLDERVRAMLNYATSDDMVLYLRSPARTGTQ